MPLLPLAHTSGMKHLDTIVTAGSLTAVKDCSVYKERLIYAFYGLAGYVYDQGALPHRLDELKPFVVLLKASGLPTPARVLPFDSGAMDRGLYDTWMKGMALADFELDPAFETAARVVNGFYGSNQKYFEGKALASPTGVGPHTAAYFSMNGDRSHSPADMRRGLVEFQFRDKVDLHPSNIMAFVLPKDRRKYPLLDRLIAASGADILEYFSALHDPLQVHGAIVSELWHYLAAKKLLP